MQDAIATWHDENELQNLWWHLGAFSGDVSESSSAPEPSAADIENWLMPRWTVDNGVGSWALDLKGDLLAQYQGQFLLDDSFPPIMQLMANTFGVQNVFGSSMPYAEVEGTFVESVKTAVSSSEGRVSPYQPWFDSPPSKDLISLGTLFAKGPVGRVLRLDDDSKDSKRYCWITWGPQKILRR